MDGDKDTNSHFLKTLTHVRYTSSRIFHAECSSAFFFEMCCKWLGSVLHSRAQLAQLTKHITSRPTRLPIGDLVTYALFCTVNEIQRLIGQISQILLTLSYLASSFEMTLFEFMEKLYGS